VTNEYEPHQVWMFEDPEVSDRWMVYVVDHIDFDVVRARAIASSKCMEREDLSWIGFQHNSWIDQHSTRIT